MIRFAIMAFALLLPALTARAEATATAAASKTEFLAGDEIVLEITFASDEETSVFFPNFKDSISKFEIRSSRSLKSEPDGHGFVTRRVYSLIAFDTGSFEIPPITVMYAKKGFPTLFPATTARIEFHSSLRAADTSGDIADIKSMPEEQPKPDEGSQAMMLLVAVCFASLALLALLIALKKKRRRSRIEYSFPTSTNDPDEAISKIEADFINNKIDNAQAVISLWEATADRAIKYPEADESKYISDLAERVKFGAYSPTKGEAEGAFLCARALVRRAGRS